MNANVNKVVGYLRWGIAGSLLLAAWGLSLTGMSRASDNYNRGVANSSGVSSPAAMAYREECGACHIAYPPGLLPEASWRSIMTTLDDHFGENAELSEGPVAMITAYLSENAGNPGRGMLKRMAGEAPLRITELPYFIRKHDEVPERLVSGNPEVGSFSNCNVCHQRAERGEFDEDTVRIPGYGRWDD
ncbi:diheme cytochrome c [Amphritea sp. 1_MG-2023]|uniref:diheme cytochrome c n=1 Tax=Amphritea sp. 1_MG-2023 TaxID=3062670 RepID=UPI0026E48C42|nr:diheme cytochrome c [Amphritea sp. 1_MG-2023]MDO6561856.1 diheme cytochrome c [Amphritea sp. 1_MG-2023]